MCVASKEKQQEAVEEFMEEKDVFVSLPTGYGKSLMYAILSSAFDHHKGSCYHVFENVAACFNPHASVILIIPGPLPGGCLNKSSER